MPRLFEGRHLNSLASQAVIYPSLFSPKRLFSGMYYGVVSLLGHDTVENVLYGVSLNGRAVMKSTTDHTAKFVGIPMSTWLEVKAKGTTTHAVHIGKSDSAIADHTINPSKIRTTNWGGEEGAQVELAEYRNHQRSFKIEDKVLFLILHMLNATAQHSICRTISMLCSPVSAETDIIFIKLQLQVP